MVSLSLKPILHRTLRRACRAPAERGLRGGEAGNRHPVRRARYIVEPDFVAERHGGRVAAVFAANAELEVAARVAAPFGGGLDQLADPLAVDRYERIGRQDPQFRIGAKEARGIVATDAECGLREIVGAEGEELRGLGDFAG